MAHAAGAILFTAAADAPCATTAACSLSRSLRWRSSDASCASTCCWMAPTTALRVAPSGTAARGPRATEDGVEAQRGAAGTTLQLALELRGSVLLSAVPTRGGSDRSHELSSLSCFRSICSLLALASSCTRRRCDDGRPIVGREQPVATMEAADRQQTEGPISSSARQMRSPPHQHGRCGGRELG